jgi:tRNA dimethylallyltransferase
MIDVADPSEAFTVARYQELALACVRDISSRGRRVVVAGGAGLYIQALTQNLRYPAAPGDGEFRARMAAIADDEGAGALHAKLAAADPEAAQRIHPNDTKRVIRALEARAYGGGATMTAQVARSRDEPPEFEFDIIGLMVERAELYERIGRRVDDMVNNGLVAETRALVDRYGVSCPALKSIGYKEIADHLEGRTSLAEALEAIKMNTRRYAKRQMTWFRKTPGLKWLTIDNSPFY